MSIEKNLLENSHFVNSSLKSFIEDEIKRIVNSGLLTKSECSNFINKVAGDVEQNDANKLLKILNAFSNIKLSGDKLEEIKMDSGELAEKILEKFNESREEAKADDKKDCGCDGECDCEERNPMVIRIVKLEEITNKLEKIAYGIGRTGDHETAYIIEKAIKEIKNIN